MTRRRHNSRKKVVARRQRHAIHRAAERYGLRLTDQDLVTIAGRIRKQKGVVFLQRLSLTKTEWLIRWNDQIVRVGYSRNTHQVSTFLPLTEEQQDALKQVPDVAPAEATKE